MCLQKIEFDSWLSLVNKNSNKYGDGEWRRKLGAGDRGRTAAVTIEGRSPSHKY